MLVRSEEEVCRKEMLTGWGKEVSWEPVEGVVKYSITGVKFIGVIIGACGAGMCWDIRRSVAKECCWWLMLLF